MGEFSKNIGEHGESLVKELLTLIGWSSVSSGITVPCLHSKKHERSQDTARTTHGIDFFHSTRSQLQDFTLDNIICSVKFSTKPYPKSASTKFKQHLRDLAQCIECFMKSEVRDSTIKNYNFSGVKRANDVGVLFWLTNNKDSDQDVISKVSNIVVDKELTFSTIHVIDNSRAAFIYDAINYIKSNFPNDIAYFHYSFSAANYADTKLSRYGSILPVEYLTSDLLPFRLVNKSNDKITFCIVCRDQFSLEVASRLLNLASDVSQDFTNDFILLFPDYDELQHRDVVDAAIRKLQGEKKHLNIVIKSFNSDFRGLVNG